MCKYYESIVILITNLILLLILFIALLSLSSSPANISVLLNGTVGISVIQIPQLTYEITLYKNDVTSLNQTIDIIQDPTHSFSPVLLLDTCYYTRTKAKNCTHETDSILSRGFILYRKSKFCEKEI